MVFSTEKDPFLKETVQVLGLEGILCIHAQEELGQNPEYREGLDMVVSRAVAQVSVLSVLSPGKNGWFLPMPKGTSI